MKTIIALIAAVCLMNVSSCRCDIEEDEPKKTDVKAEKTSEKS